MELILIILLISFFVKPKPGILACGLFGFVGSVKPNMDKIKILGLFNQSRGEEGSGLFFNNQVLKSGEFKDRKFSNFIQEHNLNFSSDNNVVIGHVRKSSYGTISTENTHPFLYYTDKKLSHVFVHNGTLRDDWKSEMYKYLSKNILKNTLSVDSNALGLLMANKKYDYLKHYKGAATFLMHDLREKNSIIAWKGASWNNNIYKEDRPLFAMKVKNGYYLSSIKEALSAISDSKSDKIINLDTNQLLKITPKKIIILGKYDRNVDNTIKTYYNQNYNQNQIGFSNRSTSTKNNNFEKDELEYDVNTYKGKIYAYKGRYYRNGHLVNGEYKVEDNGVVSNKGTSYKFHNGLIIKNNLSLSEFIKKYNSILSSGVFYYRILQELSLYVDMPIALSIEELEKTKISLDFNSLVKDYYLNGTYFTGEYNYKFSRKLVASFHVGTLSTFKVLNSKLKKIDELKQKPDEYWINFNWDSLNWDLLEDEELFQFYTEKLKKFDIVNFNEDTGKPWPEGQLFEAYTTFGKNKEVVRVEGTLKSSIINNKKNFYIVSSQKDNKYSKTSLVQYHTIKPIEESDIYDDFLEHLIDPIETLSYLNDNILEFSDNQDDSKFIDFCTETSVYLQGLFTVFPELENLISNEN